MSNRLDAKDAFAFSIDLQSQLAAVQLEDRQIIRRSLDRDFPFGRPLGSAVDFRTMRVRLGAARAKTPATTSNPSPSSGESGKIHARACGASPKTFMGWKSPWHRRSPSGMSLRPVEEDLPLRLVEMHGSGDACSQPNLQAAELVRGVDMNACMQARKDLKILGYCGRIAAHPLCE